MKQEANPEAAAPVAEAAPPTARPARSRTRRALRGLAWLAGGMVALLLALAFGAWWWIGSDQSLAFTLSRAARYLPAGQTLESREVSGSLRTGGHIGFLRWQSEKLAVEVHEATIGWSLQPLLRRQVKLGEVHAERVSIERLGPPDDKPVEPLEQLALPIEIDLPFRVDALHWGGPPPLDIGQLAGHYRYTADHHELQVDGIDIADGHYSGKLRLQGPAPMAIEAALEGKVRAPLDKERSIDVLASASVNGTLAGRDARLAVEARLKPAQEDADTPMNAQLTAHLAPWQPQPVLDARAELENVDLAQLWPQAPATLLSGEVAAGPDSTAGPNGWQGKVDLRNDRPGPWDEGKLPVERVEASASFDGTNWDVPQATIHAGGGRISAEGRWSPAPSPWTAKATVEDVQPGLLHSQLAGAPVDGRASVEQRGQALLFDLALDAKGGAGAAGIEGLRLDHADAQGQLQDQVLDLRSLHLEAVRARLDGKLQVRIAEQAANGNLNLVMPGGRVQVEGRVAPAQGAAELKATVDDATALQRWIEQLPGLAQAFAGHVLVGGAQLDARWQGGWQAIQRRLQDVRQPAARGAEPTLQATLSAPRLDIKLPPTGATAIATATTTAAAAARQVPAAQSIEGAQTLRLRNLRAEVDGSIAQAKLTLSGEGAIGTQQVTLSTQARGGLQRADQWQAALENLKLQVQDRTRPGPWTLELARSVNATLRTGAGGKLDVEASASGVTVRGPVPGTVRIDWEPVRWSQLGAPPKRVYRLQSKGRLQGFPMAWAQALGPGTLADMGVSGNLVFDGDWDIDAGDTLRAHARLARQSGDIRVQAGEAALVRRIRSTGTGTAGEITTDAASAGAGTPAGLRKAELNLDAQGEAVKADLAWESERAGQISAEAATRVQQRDGGWLWANDAPLAGKIKARLPNLGVWSMLAPPGWRIAGTLDADATLSGNRAAPRWNGTLAADQLALRAQVEGLDLRDGQLRAVLNGDRLELSEFTLRGGAASSTRITGQSGNLSTARSEAAKSGGTLSVKGTASWGNAGTTAGSGIRMDMEGQLRELRLLVRTDRQVTLSGDVQARLDAGQITVRGDLKTDRAVIILPDETAPSLGSDVFVHSAARDRETAKASASASASVGTQPQSAGDDTLPAAAQTKKPPDIEVGFDLGKDFAVQGRGITTRLEGKLDIKSAGAGTPPRITGEVRTVRGQYRAYGQQLDVESGIARFSGPFDNPGLDILAIRPNISQRAGVQITGTAQSPRVKLYSEPALTDAETLSWVMLGRASASNGGEAVVMQQAALALLGKLGGNAGGGNFASRFGLDEIGFKGPSSGGDLNESAITVGKRLSKDFYVTYERSLSGTVGTLFIFYDLTQRLTLRGQAGEHNGGDLIYTIKFN
ncbi:translocation/assembly module TamB domain-containing protein [Variovorax sp. dw_308]|uniref:translocation/assembly module TamB domain-containing protein n=1 Tax=Variovorax sp. dw_308 TaxID=2721546 RepID=UPI0035280231